MTKQELIQAKHPIIKCHYSYMNMEFDLSYADMSVFEMGKLHNTYSALNENVRIFISILRIWVGFKSGLSDPLSTGRAWRCSVICID